ncbi:MAG: hypothetical protein JXN65_01985 [Clostridia bacterium]|nr:hypothetical protein [Clostridia bacterium]
MLNDDKRKSRTEARTDGKLLNMLMSGDQSALQLALDTGTPGAQAALEETIAKYSGNENVTFYKLGGQRVYTESSMQEAKDELFSLAMDDKLLKDPAYSQSLIAALSANPALSSQLMNELSAFAQKLYDYQLLGVHMQVCKIVEDKAATQKVQELLALKKMQSDFENIMNFGRTPQEIERRRIQQQRELEEKERVEKAAAHIDEMIKHMNNETESDSKANTAIPFTKFKNAKQATLFNKLLSNNFTEVDSAVKSLTGYAIEKKQWALDTINQAIMMLKSAAINSNSVSNSFFVPNSKYLLLTTSGITHPLAPKIENPTLLKEKWLVNLKKIAKYPLLMLYDIAFTQEVIYAVLGEDKRINEILKDNRLAKRIVRLLQGQMVIYVLCNDTLPDNLKGRIHTCKRCGRIEFEHTKISIQCKKCGKQIANNPAAPIFYALCIIAAPFALFSDINSAMKWIISGLALLGLKYIVSFLVHHVKGMRIYSEYKKNNEKYNLSPKELYKAQRDMIAQYKNKQQ